MVEKRFKICFFELSKNKENSEISVKRTLCDSLRYPLNELMEIEVDEEITDFDDFCFVDTTPG